MKSFHYFFLLILDNHHLHHRIPKLHPDFSSPSTVMIIWTWNRDATVFKIMAMLWLSSVLTQNDVVSTRKRILTPGPTQSSGGRPLGRLKSPSMKILRRHNRQHHNQPSKPLFYRQISSFCLCTSIIIIVTIMIKMISIMIMTHRQAQIYCQRRQPPDQELGN